MGHAEDAKIIDRMIMKDIEKLVEKRIIMDCRKCSRWTCRHLIKSSTDQGPGLQLTSTDPFPHLKILQICTGWRHVGAHRCSAGRTLGPPCSLPEPSARAARRVPTTAHGGSNALPKKGPSALAAADPAASAWLLPGD